MGSDKGIQAIEVIVEILKFTAIAIPVKSRRRSGSNDVPEERRDCKLLEPL